MCNDNNFDNVDEFYQEINDFENIFTSDDNYNKFLEKFILDHDIQHNDFYQNDRTMFGAIIIPFVKYLFDHKMIDHIHHILTKLLSGYILTDLVMIHDPSSDFSYINNIVLDFVRYYKLNVDLHDDLTKYCINCQFINKHVSNLYKIMDGKKMLNYNSLYTFDKNVIECHDGFDNVYVINKKKLIELLK